MAKTKVTKGDRGFTLTELTFIVGLCGLAMALSVPVLSTSLRTWQLNADARNIVTTLTYAKLRATSQMTRYQLMFDLTGNNWSLQKYNRSTASFELEGATNSLSSGMAHSGISLQSTSGSAPSGFPTDSSAFIRFNSRGIPIDAAGVPTISNVVYLSDGRTDYAVTVSLTGKVQLWKYKSSQWVSQ
jgi:Tfp pilus assembly protein FimT